MDDKLNIATQHILDRLLFLRICEDRDIDTGTRLDSIADVWRKNYGPESRRRGNESLTLKEISETPHVVSYEIKDWEKKHRKYCWVDALTGDVHLTVSLKREILTHNIYGVDLDAVAVEVTQLSLCLKMLENENRNTLALARELFAEEIALLRKLNKQEMLPSEFHFLPGWTGYLNGSQVSSVTYNTIALDSSAISLHSSTSPIFQPLRGGYSVYLQGGRFSSISAAIAQTGLVPQTAQSLVFLSVSEGSLQVTFDGQIIPMIQIGTAPNYVAMGGDISAFAGQTGELRFTAFNGVGAGLIDSILFSTQAIPEPSTYLLFGCGVLLLGAARVAFKRKR